jgi:hypothetical protein
LINYGIGSYPKRGSVLPPVSKNTKQFIKVLASFSRKMSIKIIKKQELKKLSMSTTLQAALKFRFCLSASSAALTIAVAAFRAVATCVALIARTPPLNRRA